MLTFTHADGRCTHAKGAPGALSDDIVEIYAYWQQGMDPLVKRAAGVCTRLRALRVYQCQGLTSVSYTFPELTELIANGCKDLRTVEGLVAPKLTLLRVGAGTPVTKTRIPESFHPVVMPRSKVEGRARRPKPSLRSGKDGRKIRLIREMLRDWDIDRVDQGVELAAALGDEDVFRGLLDKTSIEQKPMRSCCPGMESYYASQLGIRQLSAWRLHHNGFFHTSADRRGVRDHAVLRLLEVWGDRSLVDLSAVESWVISAVGARRVDLEPVVALMPNLHTLAIWKGPTDVENWDALERLPKLTRLVTWDIDPTVPPQVTDLHVRTPRGRNLQHAKRVVLGNPPNASEVANLTGVEDLSVQMSWRGDDALLRALAALPTLRRLEIKCWSELRSVGHLGKSTSLEEVVLNTQLHKAKVQLAKLVKCPSLKRLKVQARHKTAVPGDRRHLLI